MSGGQVMVVLIVLISVFGGILKSRMGGHRHRRDDGEPLSARDDAALSAENHRLKGELADLRQRVQVLERVITDNEGSLRLDREIEKLRDRRD